jgi:GTPase
VSFRREKFVPRGGPNGGDGGRGGDVILRVNPNLNTLLSISNRHFLRAENGVHGQGSNKTGGCGADLVVDVPPGTVARKCGGEEIIGELLEPGEELVVARGGRGGRGNARFASPQNRAPRKAEEGKPGEEFDLELELKLIADLGLVGRPNAGKSTLLSRLSAARPKIAGYPFTTLEPHLGVVSAPGDSYSTLVMADIPGLIEGAHEGAGLGLQFLRHLERCRALVHLVDLSTALEDAEERITGIRTELEAYGHGLADRPWILVGTKADAVVDLEETRRHLESLGAIFGVEAALVSAVSGFGIPELLQRLFSLGEEE